MQGDAVAYLVQIYFTHIFKGYWADTCTIVPVLVWQEAWNIWAI